MDVPRRPPIIVRAPERAEKTQGKALMDSSDTGGVSPDLYSYISKTASQPTPDITVYTNTGVCRHGSALLDELRGCLFNHVDVSQSKAPSWLPGTPTVVHKSNVYCGDAAFAFVQNFDVPKTSPEKQPLANAAVKEAEPVNPFAKKACDDAAGCGLSKAFAQPAVVEVDESKFAESTDDAMQRLLAGRR